jgi:hypothetical protein
MRRVVVASKAKIVRSRIAARYTKGVIPEVVACLTGERELMQGRWLDLHTASI